MQGKAGQGVLWCYLGDVDFLRWLVADSWYSRGTGDWVHTSALATTHSGGIMDVAHALIPAGVDAVAVENPRAVSDAFWNDRKCIFTR